MNCSAVLREKGAPPEESALRKAVEATELPTEGFMLEFCWSLEAMLVRTEGWIPAC